MGRGGKRTVETRTIAEPSGSHEPRLALPDEAQDQVQRAAQEVGAARERGGADWVEERPARDADIHEVVGAVIQGDAGVQRLDEVCA
jgi:hypothetical protein